jgi:HlyD family secretion protein
VVLIASWITVGKMRAAKANEPTIETAKVEKGTVVNSVSATGILQPLTTIDLKSNVGGQIDKLAVDVGTVVKAGQIIATVDPTDSRTALNQAEADLSAANARLFQSKQTLTLQTEQHGVEVQQAQNSYDTAVARLAQAEAQAKVQPTLTKASIKQAQANYVLAQQNLRQLKEAGAPVGTIDAKSSYNQAKASTDKAKRNLDRQQGLFDKGFISASAYDDAKLTYDNAAAQAESAKERLDTIGQDYDAQLKASEARVDQAAASLDNAKANAVQDEMKRQDLAAARSAVGQALASLRSAKANALQIPIKAADIRTSQSGVVRSQATLDNAKTSMNYTTIRAPRAGVVLKKYVEAGTIINSGRSSNAGTGAGTSVVQLGDLSRMYVFASVDETDISNVEMNQKVDVTLDAFPDEIFEGVVTRIDPQTVLDQNVTTIPVTVEITDPDARLKPGMNATCDFIIERKEDVLVVPTEAVKDQDGKYSVTVLKDGKQIERKVEVGIAGDQTTEIVSGLKLGDVVVTAVIEPQSSSSSTGGSRGGGGGGRGGGMPMGGMGGGRFGR